MRSLLIVSSLIAVSCAEGGTFEPSTTTHQGMQWRFSERDDLGGLTLSDAPVVFIEAGNMRNAVDASMLRDTGFQEAIARAIVEAISAFLGAGDAS